MQNPIIDREEVKLNLEISSFNPMQTSAIKAIKSEKNVLLLSPTGTGKTLAFTIPLLESLKPHRPFIQALIVVPSRELALQIEAILKKSQSIFRVCCCYGGHSMKVEKNNFSTLPDILVGTPGRIIDHLRQETLSFLRLKL